jgi:uncharacterized repeat protein (TIGR03837 family)
MQYTWDIFCKVIDNYGDIGIAWRLARQLVAEHGLPVRLWVDDLQAFSTIWPTIKHDAACQSCEGVEVRAWCEPFAEVHPATVVIEAFGCALPVSYLAAMARLAIAPVWINLEYLSAERWVSSHHGLPSPHPQLPLTKYFFFPGYEASTGGLLREHDLAGRREFFLRQAQPAFWRRLGLTSPAPATVCVSLFAYENAVLPVLLDAWADGDQAIRCLLPQGRLVPQIAAWAGQRLTKSVTRGNLELHIVPFQTQDDYDHLLWICDLNFVRGEDSCVRAQWAQQPFVWQAYPQADNAHRAKLDALLDRYVDGLPEDEADAVAAMWLRWNVQTGTDMPCVWNDFIDRRVALTAHAMNWAGTLAQSDDLARRLVRFVEQHRCG